MKSFYLMLLILVYCDASIYHICDDSHFEIRSKTGYIVSPDRLKLSAPANLCVVQFENPVSSGSIVFKFNHFEVYSSDSQCSDAFLSLNGKRFCGWKPSRQFCSNEKVITAEFSPFNNSFELFYEVFDQDACTCFTETNQRCIFPFVYNSEVHHQCAGGNSIYNPPFCATSVDADGVLATRGNCNMSLEACEQKCSTDSGLECIFPYEDVATG